MQPMTRSLIKDLQDCGIAYLACPYSHESGALENMRAKSATRLAVWLTKQGVTVFSPLTMTTEMDSVARASMSEPMPHDYDFWREHDRRFIEASGALVVLALDGWSDSVGVTDEIHAALDNSLPIVLAESHPREDDEYRFTLQPSKYTNRERAKRGFPSGMWSESGALHSQLSMHKDL